MSGWEIATVAVLVLALVIGIVVLVAYLLEAERRIPPPGQDPRWPPIVFRDPASMIELRPITVRSHDARQLNTTGELNPLNDGHHIEKREIQDDVDLYCKLTGRIVRECRCEDCRKLKVNLGT